MASQSHHHHLCHQSPTTRYCHCCSPYTQCHHPPPSPPLPDYHLHPPPPPQPHFYSAHTHPPQLHQYRLHIQERSFQDDEQAQQTVPSLLRRIAALESALRRRSSSSNTLRNAAARTIQTHFRAFLLRRSRTLRHFKELASIKSKLGLLKSSVSEKSHFHYSLIYQNAVDLLLKLDTIQGGDPMIREGKTSIRRELNRFLDFIDGFYAERIVISREVNLRNSVKHRTKMCNVKCGDMRSGNSEKLRDLVERIDKLTEELDEEALENVCEIQPKVKKSVTFADNGKAHRVILDENCYNDTDILVNAKRDFEVNIHGEVEEFGAVSKEGEGEDDDGGFLSSSDDEKGSRSYVINEGNLERMMAEQHESNSNVLAFAAPLPLKMEARTNIYN